MQSPYIKNIKISKVVYIGYGVKHSCILLVPSCSSQSRGNTRNSGAITRNPWGDTQTDFAQKYLVGQGFSVESEWVNVKQTSADTEFDYFAGKSEDVIPNELINSNEGQTGVRSE